METLLGMAGWTEITHSLYLYKYNENKGRIQPVYTMPLPSY